MSRIRSVHPGFFTDEDLVAVSMGARLLFIGLGVEADDKGVFEWKPTTIKMRIFPADNIDVAALLTQLEEVGAIKKFEIAGRTFGAIRNFRKFQKPKTPNDIHPASDEILAFVGLSISETKPAEEPPFPPKGEKTPQMEDGGGKREDGKESSPSGECASDDAPEFTPDHVFDFWNADIAPLGKTAVRKRTPERRQLVKARIGQSGLPEFQEMFANIRGSPFLLEAKGLQFDWFMQKKNFTKVLEGNYNG